MPKPINAAEIKKKLEELKKRREQERKKEVDRENLGTPAEREAVIKTVREVSKHPNFEKIPVDTKLWLANYVPYKEQIYILRAIAKAKPADIDRLRKLTLAQQKEELRKMGEIEELEELF